jgi:hypothetical protein
LSKENEAVSAAFVSELGWAASLWLGVAGQVSFCAAKEARFVFEKAQATVAVVAEQTANDFRAVTVVDVQSLLRRLLADRTATILLRKKGDVLLQAHAALLLEGGSIVGFTFSLASARLGRKTQAPPGVDFHPIAFCLSQAGGNLASAIFGSWRANMLRPVTCRQMTAVPVDRPPIFDCKPQLAHGGNKSATSVVSYGFIKMETMISSCFPHSFPEFSMLIFGISKSL